MTLNTENNIKFLSVKDKKNDIISDKLNITRRPSFRSFCGDINEYRCSICVYDNVCCSNCKYLTNINFQNKN